VTVLESNASAAARRLTVVVWSWPDPQRLPLVLLS
jgi:hypothetical protein